MGHNLSLQADHRQEINPIKTKWCLLNVGIFSDTFEKGELKRPILVVMWVPVFCQPEEGFGCYYPRRKVV